MQQQGIGQGPVPAQNFGNYESSSDDDDSNGGSEEMVAGVAPKGRKAQGSKSRYVIIYHVSDSYSVA